MAQRICSNDSNQFYSFTIWYSRGTVDLYPYSDSPMLKLGADLQYLISLGRTPILVQEFSPDGYQFLACEGFSAYQATHGDAVWSPLTGGENPVGSITNDGFPTCYSIPGNAPGMCPPGYVWNNATEQCDPLPPPPPIVPPPIPPPPPPPVPSIIVPPPNPPPPPLGQPDPGGDEITDQLCRQIAADTAAIVYAINQLQGDGGLGATACCAAVVNAIAGVEATLIRILTILPNLAPPKTPPLDVTAVIAELTCICKQLTVLAGSSSAIPTSLDTGLKSISDAISNAKPVDLSQVVEQLKEIVREGDIPQDFIDWLASEGFLSPEAAQQLSGVDWSKGLAGIFRTAGWTALTWFMYLYGYTWNGHKFVGGSAGDILLNDLGGVFRAVLTATESALTPSVKAALAYIEKLLTPTTISKLGENAVDPDRFITTAISAMVEIWSTSFLEHLGDLIPGESINHLLETLTGLMGVEELRDVQIGPLIQYGPARVAEMRAKFLYRQEMPGINTLATLRARGLLDDADYNGLEGLTGVPPQLARQIRDAGQSGLNARMMLRLVGTGLFSDADVVDELTFAGMRQTSQHRLVLAAAYLATEPERGKLRSALESAYRAGMVSDSDLVSRLESAEHNTDRTNLLLETVQLEKQIVLAKEYESAYSREFLAGLLDAPGYQSALESLGMQPADIAARLFRDETHLSVTTSIQAARQARALQRAEASAERKTAIEQYRTGNSNEALLLASLLSTGLSPVQAAAMVAYQTLASSGVLRWIFGLHLPPSQATLLRQRVSDLTRQREIGMLSDSQYVSSLTALNIPPNYINALRAGANAHVSPKTAAVLTPVITT